MPRALLIGLALALAAVFWPWSVGAQQGPLRLLGQYSFESRRMFQGTTIGGLSGLTYDAKRNVYYAVSDDRGENQSPRFYTLQIDVDASGVKDVRVVGVTTLDSDAASPGIQPFALGASDFEDIELLNDDTFIISSERDQRNIPWLGHFALDGSLLGYLQFPDKYVSVYEPGPDGRPRTTHGIRNNLGFEGISPTPENDALFLINEEALTQDGPVASPEAGTNVRLLRMTLDANGTRPTNEWVYTTDKVFTAPDVAGAPFDNGVSAMIYVRQILPQYDLLTLERAFVAGIGNDVNIFGVVVDDASDVSDLDALPQPFTGKTVQKTLLANIRALGIEPDNLEAMAIGPSLPNGHPILVVISDDNFSAAGAPQINQFIAFEIDLTGQ
jgi:3-phytase/alkaline phosphatase D